MSDKDEEEMELRYQIENIESCDPPAGMPPGQWHRYVIGQGMSKIEGLRPGSRDEVRRHAEEVVQGLNERVNKSVSSYARSKK